MAPAVFFCLWGIIMQASKREERREEGIITMVQISNDSDRAYGQGDASFQAAGGEVGVKRLVWAFYEQMHTLEEAKIIRAMHPKDLDQSRDKLYRFLCGWLGGPKLYQEKYGPINIPGAHRHLDIGIAERDAWLLCMQRAADEQPYAEDFKAYLLKQLYPPANFSRTRD
jgi:hemoglobin